MIQLLTRRRCGPIGVDIGSRCVKLLQLSGDQSRLVDAVRWDVPEPEAAGEPSKPGADRIVDTLRQAQQGRSFRGRDAVLCLTRDDLFLQNLRVPRGSEEAVRRAAEQEAANRLPFPIAEAEVRLVPVAEVRQQDMVVQEVLLFACRRDCLQDKLTIAEKAGLNPVAVDIEPAALVRSCQTQYRREEDRDQRLLYVHLGYSSTAAVIAQGEEVLFVKYIDCGGRYLDEAVANRLNMDLGEATALRRHNGDRRSDQQDPDIARTVSEATRPVVERLASELAMCVRYHSVTFRGRPLERMVFGGGESDTALAETLGERLRLKCDLGDPLRVLGAPPARGRAGQWDVVTGLALRKDT
jgi:type IV pilus assembly protein PilM